MEIFKLSDMIKGWFVGDFEPVIHRTKECEVGIKTYIKGTIEPKHYHKKAIEITGIIKGKARINDILLGEGDLIVIKPFEEAEFEAIEDVTTVVFKSSSHIGDKFMVND